MNKALHPLAEAQRTLHATAKGGVGTDVLPSVPDALRILDRLENEVDHAETFVEVQAIAGAAAGWQRAFKPVSTVSNRAGVIWSKAERRLGIELAKEPKAKGTRGQLVGPGIIGGSISEPPIDDASTLKAKGVDKKRSARAQKLANMRQGERTDLELPANLPKVSQPDGD